MTRVPVVSTIGVDDHDTGRHHPEAPAAPSGRASAASTDADATVCVDSSPATGDPRRARTSARRLRYLDRLEQFVAGGGGALDADTIASRGFVDDRAAAPRAAVLVARSTRSRAGDCRRRVRRDAAARATTRRATGRWASASSTTSRSPRRRSCARRRARAHRRLGRASRQRHPGHLLGRPAVMYVSTHQSPFYPGTGAPDRHRRRGAPGSVFNFALPAGATRRRRARAPSTRSSPRPSSASRPTWVLVSAGFDAHRDDPLAELAWSTGDYALLVDRVRRSHRRPAGSRSSSKAATTSAPSNAAPPSPLTALGDGDVRASRQLRTTHRRRPRRRRRHPHRHRPRALHLTRARSMSIAIH